jgi:hypothetical protein
MASISELWNLPSLQYDTGRGLTFDDSGAGGPRGGEGWVRTGTAATGDPNGNNSANCVAWTSSSAQDFGTSLTLWLNNRNDSSQRNSCWYEEDGGGSIQNPAWLCNRTRHVWCIED